MLMGEGNYMDFRCLGTKADPTRFVIMDQKYIVKRFIKMKKRSQSDMK